MKITNYTEWKQAVLSEFTKLADVSYYLNENGTERMLAFDTLICLYQYCDTPEELLSWIENKEDLDENDIKSLNSGHVASAINALRRIARAKEE